MMPPRRELGVKTKRGSRRRGRGGRGIKVEAKDEPDDVEDVIENEEKRDEEH
jgi:hypothetical protein